MTFFDSDEITLMSRGDLLFLYTDGVYDGDDGLERQRIEKVFQENKQKPAKELCNAVLEYALHNDDHLRQIGEPDRIDDKTVFIIKRQ